MQNSLDPESISITDNSTDGFHVFITDVHTCASFDTKLPVISCNPQAGEGDIYDWEKSIRIKSAKENDEADLAQLRKWITARTKVLV